MLCASHDILKPANCDCQAVQCLRDMASDDCNVKMVELSASFLKHWMERKECNENSKRASARRNSPRPTFWERSDWY